MTWIAWALARAAVLAMLAALSYAWWWETSGRREWEREWRRREDADYFARRKTPRRRPGA